MLTITEIKTQIQLLQSLLYDSLSQGDQESQLRLLTALAVMKDTLIEEQEKQLNNLKQRGA